MTVDTREGTIAEALEIIRLIPEFDQSPGEEAWHQRMAHDPLVLIATSGLKLVGFKAGYDRRRDGDMYYSWLGGVLPDFRGNGVATALQHNMERWCLDRGYSKLQFKTRNRHRNMIHFGIRHGFDLVDFERKGDISDYRLTFEKVLHDHI